MWSYNYSGIDTGNYIKHWKYVRKYKNSSGEWVYVYPNDKYGIKNYIDTKITGKAYQQHVSENQKEKQHLDRMASSQQQSLLDAAANSKGPSYKDPKVKAILESQRDTNDKVLNLIEDTNEANQSFYNQSIVGLAKSTIRAGKEAVSRLFKKK